MTRRGPGAPSGSGTAMRLTITTPAGDGFAKRPPGEVCAPSRAGWWWCLALLVLGLGAAGCQSSGAGGGHASVHITGHSLESIRSVTKEVFNKEGYSLMSSPPDSMTFQRFGGVGDAVLYGGWGDDNVATRVRVRFESPSALDCTLLATVYTVRDAGDRLMEEESRKIVINRGPYKSMLKEVKRRLEAPAARSDSGK